jgi:hypothetical protein
MNERVINRLADSKPIRNAARWVVYVVHRFRAIKPEEFGVKQEEIKSLTSRLGGKLKEIAEDLEKKAKKP